MKSIFICIYDGDTEKNFIHSGVIDAIVARNYRVILLVRGEDRVPYYKKQFRSNSAVVVETLPPSRSQREALWHHISWNSIPTNAVYVRLRRNFRQNKNFITLLLKLVLWRLSYLRHWRNFLRWIYALEPDSYAAQLFERYKPDIVFSPNMFSSSDFRTLRAARRRNIPTVTTAKSWDVLVTKAFTRVRADRIIVFNEINASEAVVYGDYKPEQVSVVGFPQFDVYARTQERTAREVFARRYGVTPDTRFVLFGVPGDWVSPYSKDILERLSKRIVEGFFTHPTHIIARLHPKYRDQSESLALPHVTVERPGTLLKDHDINLEAAGDLYSWTFSKEDIEHLADSIFHADVVICTVSTLVLDAAANDTPTILVAYDGDAVVPHWASVARMYEREYYESVLETGGVIVAQNHDQLEQALKKFFANPLLLRKERDLLRKRLLFADDGQSAVRMAQAIVGVLDT